MNEGDVKVMEAEQNKYIQIRRPTVKLRMRTIHSRLKITAETSHLSFLIFPQQLSQFWYSDETALCLAKEGIAASETNGRIACVSAPSIYQKLKGLAGHGSFVCLLEYDKRFSTYGEDFIFYDYNHPLNLPERLQQHSFDIVIADPPYLSEECLRKTAETIRYLTRGKILLCTGAVMEDLAVKILGLKMCKFIPKHTRSLANEFRCYANYELGLDSQS
ncbi:hypothetical protein FKM82_009697 [Ascaphus truei]